MGGFTAAMAAVGVGMQAYGMWQSGQDAAAAAAYNANMYNAQAQIIESKKVLTRQEYDRMIDQLEGSTISAIASSGYDMSGSYLAVMNDSLTQANLDKEKALYNLEIEKFQAGSRASEATRAGKRAQDAANVGALSTVLTEGNDWYSKYGKSGGTTNAPKLTSTNTGPSYATPSPGSRPPAGSGIIGHW